MNKNIFKYMMSLAYHPEFSDHKREEILDLMAMEEVEKTNLVITMEELAELSQEISKWYRGRSVDKYTILEEMADIRIVILLLKRVCNISNEELIKAIDIKLFRNDQRNRMDLRNCEYELLSF